MCDLVDCPFHTTVILCAPSIDDEYPDIIDIPEPEEEHDAEITLSFKARLDRVSSQSQFTSKVYTLFFKNNFFKNTSLRFFGN